MKHKALDTIGIHSLKIAHDFFEKHSLNLDELYQACNFTFDDLKTCEKAISIDTFLKSMDLVYGHIPHNVRMEDVLCDHLKLSDIGFFGFTLMSSPNLEEALTLLMNSFAILNPSFKIQRLDLNNGNMLLVINNNFFFKHHQKAMMELTVLMFLNVFELFIEDVKTADENEAIKVLPYIQDDERVIAFPKSILQNASKMKNAIFYEAQKKLIADKLSRYTKEESYVEQVKKIINDFLSQGTKPKIQMIADTLGISSKTLARRLHSNNTSFQSCIDDVVYQLTIDFIEQGRTVKEIAYYLGFSSVTGLNYVFSKNTGMSIIKYKKKYLEIESSIIQNSPNLSVN